MLRARRALSAVAAIWLVCHAATLAVAPAMLGASLADCECIHGAEAMCPMHHTTSAGFKVCAMRSVTTSTTATLNALFSVAALVPVRHLAMAPVPTACPMRLECSTATERPSPPDPPPPRA